MSKQTDQIDPRTMGARPDFTIDQGWNTYTADEHKVWDELYERQMKLLPGYATDEFMQGLDALDLHCGGIPDFGKLSDELEKLTGWRIVAVPCLVPDDIFFDHLANKRFPAGNFIRKRDQMDYIQEPDVFHDVFGHVPMLTNQTFADFMQAYGRGGMRSLEWDALKNLAALYWYTVEFGLIQTDKGLRIYGAGIVSSKSESIFSLEDPSPNRIGFDLARLMSTDYRIDDFQQTYFVIDSFDQLLRSAVDTDFAPLYDRMLGKFSHTPEDVLAEDKVVTVGTQAYEKAGGRFARAG